jgi:hypothetical protein
LAVLVEVYKRYKITATAGYDPYTHRWIPKLLMVGTDKNDSVYFSWPPTHFNSEKEAEEFAMQGGTYWLDEHSI